MTTENPPTPSRFDLDACQHILDGLRNQIGEYEAAWATLRAAQERRRRAKSSRLAKMVSRLRGDNSSFEIDFAKFRRTIDPAKPFFIAQTQDGIRFLGDARDYPSVLHALNPDFNSILITALMNELTKKPGDCIDVGTNLGIVAASMAVHLGARGHVYCLEASPATLKLAAGTLALNRVSNATLFHAAASNQDGELTFHATPGNSAIASVRRHDFGLLNEWTAVTVPACRLDTLVSREALTNVRLVKIDVEGHEIGVLDGMAELLKTGGPTVVYEYTPVAAANHGWTQEDSLRCFTKESRFEFTALGESDGKIHPFPLPAGYMGQVNVFARPS